MCRRIVFSSGAFIAQPDGASGTSAYRAVRHRPIADDLRAYPVPAHRCLARLSSLWVLAAWVSWVCLLLVSVLLATRPAGAQEVQITYLSNFGFFDLTPHSGTQSKARPLCVYHSGDGNYWVTVSDSVPDGQFTARHVGLGSGIPIEVYWSNSRNKAGRFALTENVAAAGQDANTISPSCDDRRTANLSVDISESAIAEALAGDYATTLTIFIEPR